MTRYRIAQAHKESRVREALDILAFLFLLALVVLLVCIADVRDIPR